MYDRNGRFSLRCGTSQPLIMLSSGEGCVYTCVNVGGYTKPLIDKFSDSHRNALRDQVTTPVVS